jgi:hypothetical protein
MSRRRGDTSDVEFLEPRDFAFGGDGPADFAGVDLDEVPEDDEQPRSKWLAGTAGVLVVALVAVGVVAAAPWDGSGGQAAPTSTVAPTTTATPVTTTPAPTTTVDDDSVGGVGAGSLPGYLFDPLPEGYAITSAWDSTGTGTSPQGWAEVWASPGATRSTGRWFSLLLSPGWFPDYFGEATRLDLGGRTGYLREQADGVLALTTPIEYVRSNHSLTVTASGFTLDELAYLASSVVVADVRLSGVLQPGFGDAAVVDGLEQLAAQPSDQDLLERYVSSWTGKHASYTDGARESYVEVMVTESDDSNQNLARIALGPPPLAGPLVIGDIPGASDLTLGTINAWGDDPLSVARWHDGQRLITVVSTEPVDRLAELLPRLRATTDREWDAAVRRAESVVVTPDDIGMPTGPPIDIGSGVLPNGDAWNATFQRPEWINFQTPDFPIGTPLRSVDRVMINTLPDYTLLIVSIDAASPASSARVSIGGMVVAEAPVTALTALDPTIEYAAKVGVLAFDQPGLFTVEFVDATGAVVDTVSSPGNSPGFVG